MVKTYLRYAQHDSFGVITSANAVFDATGKFAITASLEDIVCWNIRQGTKTLTLRDTNVKARVTTLALSPDNITLASGHGDGTLRLWDYQEAQSQAAAGAPGANTAPRATLTGHRADVTCMSFSRDGAVLVTGSADTELIAWDVVAEKGIIRLRGHRDWITACYLIEEDRKVISASKDGMVKVWDLETQRCVQTLVGHHNPVWALAVSPDHSTLVTGSLDNKLRFWRLGQNAESFIKKEEGTEAAIEDEENYAQYFGTVERTPNDKDFVGGLTYNKDGTVLACHSSEGTIDIFSVASLAIATKRMKKRQVKRERKKKKLAAEDGAKGTEGEGEKKGDEEEEEKGAKMLPVDFYTPLETVRTNSKVKSFAFDSALPTRQFMLSLGNNVVEVYKFGIQTEDQEEMLKEGKKPACASALATSLNLEGHRSDVRFVALSYDNSRILSASNQSVKIYNVHTRKCVRTIEVQNGLCGAFVPGDMHVIVGTKSGKLLVIELASGSVKEVSDAHSEAVWSVCVYPNGQGLASASADKSVKFWSFDLQKKTRDLSLIQQKSLDVESDAMCVRISPDSKYVAVALLDYTVKIYHMATLKFFLSLYGHKLPVLSIDISSDSTLIVTGSADKNFKIWGLDFGDCHKSIFAHDDSVTQVAFVPNTHYIFTAGKDKLVKYWDGDKFEHIQTLTGHQSEVWGLAVSTSGRFVVTSSHDRSIRIWEQTDEQLFLEEERENELDTMFEESLLEERRVDPDDPTAPQSAEMSRPSRVTIESIKGSERILEALGFIQDPETTLAVAMLQGRAPEEYLFTVISSLRPSDVEEALLLLPYLQITTLIHALNAWISKCSARSLEVACRTLFFLLSVHHKQLTLDNQLLPVLLELNEKVKAALRGYKRVVGVNRAALGVLQREVEHSKEGYQPLFKIADLRAESTKKRNRKKNE